MMNPDLVQWLVPVATIAAAWGGTRQALNGTRALVKETREEVKGISRNLNDHVVWEADKYSQLTERVVAVEVKLDTRIK